MATTYVDTGVTRNMNGAYRRDTFAEDIEFFIEYTKTHGKLVDTPDGMVRQHMELMDINPERADLLLTRNFNNRTLTKKRVEDYARDMKEGRWNPATAEPIAISPEGVMGNGQHRLNAIIESGVTIPMWIAFGVTKKAVHRMDAGKPRTAEGNLQMEGYSNTKEWAKFAQVVSTYTEGEGPSFHNKLTNDGRQRLMEQYKNEFYDALANVPHDKLPGFPPVHAVHRLHHPGPRG